MRRRSKNKFHQNASSTNDDSAIVRSTNRVLRAARSGGTKLPQLLVVLFVARIASALYNPINDCDETFNYWEPVHYLTYGTGLQTWEYSPLFAIRSYAYLLPAVVLGTLLDTFGLHKITVFYATRVALALFCAFCERKLILSVFKCFGRSIALYLALLLIPNCGMFLSSSAFLPNSFAMCCLMIAFSCWISLDYRSSIVAVACSAVLGWPFAAAAALPLLADALWHRGVVRLLLWSIVITVSIVFPVLLIDSLYYDKFTFASYNIVWYNVLGGANNAGSALYGVEAWHFYVRNLLLNFNVIFILALISLPLCLLSVPYFDSRLKAAHGSGPLSKAESSSNSKSLMWLKHLAPVYLWLAIMSLQAHKEERFMFILYPLICFNACVALFFLSVWCSFLFRAVLPGRLAQYSDLFSDGVQYVIIFVYALLSVARILFVCFNFFAPLQTYSQLSSLIELQRGANISACVGKEWHRFPSSHFLPPTAGCLHFVDGGFRGLLPKPFEPLPNGTWIIPSSMNTENREERDRYVDLLSCDYLVDVDTAKRPPAGFRSADWRIVSSVPFYDREAARLQEEQQLVQRGLKQHESLMVKTMDSWLYLPGSSDRRFLSLYTIYERAERRRERP